MLAIYGSNIVSATGQVKQAGQKVKPTITFGSDCRKCTDAEAGTCRLPRCATKDLQQYRPLAKVTS
jgi:hypothetical protein